VGVLGAGGAALDVRILLVDDRRENLLALESILGSLGHELVTASNGEEALRAVLREDFAVILLDVRMPGMDGFEVASHIRMRERSRDTPVIFLTAAGDGPHQTLRGYAAGAADYLTKPFDPWVLRAKVGVFTELYRKNRQLREQAEMLRDQAGVTPHVMTELSGRLSAIEGSLALLIEQSGREGPVGRLERRVVRMRAALDAVRV
jgi:CheY-like chemotaxis protein